MTNAQWMIKNHMSFQNVKVKLDIDSVPMQNLDRTKEYVITQIVYGDMLLTDFESETNEAEWRRKFIKVFFKWLDEEHKEILTDDEKYVLKESIKPYRNRVINIHKTLQNDDNSVCFISVLYNTDDQKPKTWCVDDAQIYMIKRGEGLQFAGMIPCVDYTVEELNLGGTI